jgi:hypothetical protein
MRGVRLIHLPGHSPGSMALLVELDHAGSVLLTGDALYFIGVAPNLRDESVLEAEGKVNVAVKTCRVQRAGTPKNDSCSQEHVARTTTRSPSATTSSIVHFWSIGPIVANRTRSPSGPLGSRGGPPYIRQLDVINRLIASTSPS